MKHSKLMVIGATLLAAAGGLRSLTLGSGNQEPAEQPQQSAPEQKSPERVAREKAVKDLVNAQGCKALNYPVFIGDVHTLSPTNDDKEARASLEESGMSELTANNEVCLEGLLHTEQATPNPLGLGSDKNGPIIGVLLVNPDEHDPKGDLLRSGITAPGFLPGVSLLNNLASTDLTPGEISAIPRSALPELSATGEANSNQLRTQLNLSRATESAKPDNAQQITRAQNQK